VDNYVKCLNQTQSSGGQQGCMDKFYKSINLGSPGAAGHVTVQVKARSGQVDQGTDDQGRLIRAA
jgi:hypothetical protein